jgi:hypothetical protein
MKTHVKTERIEVTLGFLYEVRRHIGVRKLEENDWPLVGALVTKAITGYERQQERMFARLQAAAAQSQPGDSSAHETCDDAGDSTGDAPPDCGEPNETSGATAPTSEAPAAGDTSSCESPEPELTNPSDLPADKPKENGQGKGHGRNGADAYTAAHHVWHALAAGIIGTLCEKCRKSRMLRYREKVVIRIVGQSLFQASLHHYEQARCKHCGHIVRATGPANVLEGIGTSYVMYDWSACAMLIVMHYFAGAPFKRLESLHQSWGIPLADANQWELVNKSDDLLFPLYRSLERYAIQKATNFRIDDTGSMIVWLAKQIREEIAALKLLGESTRNVRTGINATGVYWETPVGPVILFFTGLHHAGEIIDQLLAHRPISDPKLVKVTDGASKNFDHAQKDKLVEATCNAHALLKFAAVKDKYPTEYATAGRLYKQIFDYDDKAKALGLNPMQRMLYHRQYSKPLMMELKQMCAKKLESRLVEPNSPLWEALNYVINQWERLTQFYQVPDVPLDSNRVEQALIMPVRYLAGSFNYQTQDGAVVGDHHMSLIATARANDVEPVAYLTECLRCHEDLARRPEHYLPWVYRERLKQQTSPPLKQQTSPPPPQHPPTSPPPLQHPPPNIPATH